jgi:sigma-B regulation protein RsbU (phosphoserine phosphatase)
MYHLISEQPAPIDRDTLRSDLLDRRHALESASTRSNDRNLAELLAAVDAALTRVSDDTLGICEVCDAPIETDLLRRNPLATVCLECLPIPQRRALEKDLALASTIQAELLPDPDFETPDWVGHYSYRPYGNGPVSGDFCEVIHDRGHTLVVFGDVSGKGVSAALLMSHLSAIVRALAGSERSPVEMMQRVNRMFCAASPLKSFATLVAIRLGTNGEVEVVNAGHLPPLLDNGSVRQIPAHGVPIGLFCESEYTSKVFRMNPDDRLVLATDGTVESTDGNGDEYGLDALTRVVASAPKNSPRDLVNRVLEEIELFRNGRPAEDDATVMVIQRISS